MVMRRTIGWMLLATALAALGMWQASATRHLPGKTPAPGNPKALRIASLTLASDEILSQLVPAERLACVTYLADDPEISNVPDFYPARIPRLRDRDLERILALEPDLVCVAPYNSADFLKMIERSGIAVYRSEAFHTIDQIEAGILELSHRVGEPERGREIQARMHARRAELANRLRGIARRPGVLFWSGGFTSGKNTTIDDIIREAGGVNLAAGRGLSGPAEISPEQVIAADPEIVLLSQWTAGNAEGDIKRHPLLRNLPAVREHRLIVIEGRYLSSVSQFAVEGIERLARKLHPDRFTAADQAGSHPTAGALRTAR